MNARLGDFPEPLPHTRPIGIRGCCAPHANAPKEPSLTTATHQPHIAGCTPRPTTSDAPATPTSARPDEVLRAFLACYWLRPENALWMTLRSMVLSHARLEPPAADLSCGDGVFTFLHCGGRFDDSFDVFRTVRRVDGTGSARTDMFDYHDADYMPPIARRPHTIVDVGTDLKPALLAKADALGFYRRLVQHDNNHPLPFEDDAFATVYCNSAYWVRRIDVFLRELVRVTRRDGAAVLHVKLAAMSGYTLAGFRDMLGDTFLDIIGRGRFDCWPTVATRNEWEQRFARAGFEIVDARPFVTRTHAHIWDIGLRPIAPLLVRMANEIDDASRLSIKRDWIALLEDLLRPLCRPDFDLFAQAAEPAEIQYVLRPRA
ncbi:MAG: methyltransferase domain-containing protein [Planctomycetota bacterium]|nr:MAG: methyltransferase domain-containing protein [Planctomycetota bacterium]